MSTVKIGTDTFEMQCDMLDVTSMHRPDTAWLFVDANGHEHRWFVDGKPAGDYRATERYDVPTLVWVKDGYECWEDDDEPHDVGHNECSQCGLHIEPRYTADAYTQYAPGMRRYRINGENVPEDEFKRRYEAHLGKTD